MQRKDNFIEGEYYHLYNRGNSKQKIFLDNQDRDRFIKLLYLCNSIKRVNFREDIIKRKKDVWDFDKGKPIISIGAWVLMPNHFHIFITVTPNRIASKNPKSNFGQIGQKQKKQNAISTFMQKVCTSYSKYFNKKHGRAGSLFETNFKSSRADADKYLKYLFSYIHLNPIKLIDSKWKENGVKNIQAAKDFLKNYKWSSYRDYCGPKRVEAKILSKKDFPDYFENQKIFKKEIFDWLSFKLD